MGRNACKAEHQRRSFMSLRQSSHSKTNSDSIWSRWCDHADMQMLICWKQEGTGFWLKHDMLYGLMVWKQEPASCLHNLEWYLAHLCSTVEVSQSSLAFVVAPPRLWLGLRECVINVCQSLWLWTASAMNDHIVINHCQQALVHIGFTNLVAHEIVDQGLDDALTLLQLTEGDIKSMCKIIHDGG